MTDFSRYSRQTFFAEIGEAGQQKLLQSRVAVVGLGALGSVISQLLVRAGVGHLTVIDRDLVELHNLQRQTLYDEEDVRSRLPKAYVAGQKLRRINSEIEVREVVADLNPKNAGRWLGEADLILDGSDNLETRFLINDFCVAEGKPWIYGGVIGSVGMTMNIVPGQTACLRCVFSELPGPGELPSCDTVGILNSLPALVGAIKVAEAIKLLIGSADWRRDLLWLDLWKNQFKTLQVSAIPSCECCGQRKFSFLEAKATAWVTALCGRNTVQISPAEERALDLSSLSTSLARHGRVENNGYLLNFQPREDQTTLVIFPTGRVLVQGTHDEALARSLYAKYLGG
jgi:molybdopterin-synthase adenylyltransferase